MSLEQSSEESSESDEESDIEEITTHEVTENGPSVQESKIESPTEVVEVKSTTESMKNVKDSIPNEQESENKKVKKKNLDKDVAKTSEVKVEKKPLLSHTTVNVEVKRDPKIQVARLKLPILGEEQRIMELINENEFLIVAGETGMTFNCANNSNVKAGSMLFRHYCLHLSW